MQCFISIFFHLESGFSLWRVGYACTGGSSCCKLRWWTRTINIVWIRSFLFVNWTWANQNSMIMCVRYLRGIVRWWMFRGWGGAVDSSDLSPNGDSSGGAFGMARWSRDCSGCPFRSQMVNRMVGLWLGNRFVIARWGSGMWGIGRGRWGGAPVKVRVVAAGGWVGSGVVLVVTVEMVVRIGFVELTTWEQTPKSFAEFVGHGVV